MTGCAGAVVGQTLLGLFCLWWLSFNLKLFFIIFPVKVSHLWLRTSARYNVCRCSSVFTSVFTVATPVVYFKFKVYIWRKSLSGLVHKLAIPYFTCYFDRLASIFDTNKVFSCSDQYFHPLLTYLQILSKQCMEPFACLLLWGSLCQSVLYSWMTRRIII